MRNNINSLSNEELFTLIKILAPDIYNIYVNADEYPKLDETFWIYDNDDSNIWEFVKTIYDDKFDKGVRFTYVFRNIKDHEQILNLRTINFVYTKDINNITDDEKEQLYAFYKLMKPFK